MSRLITHTNILVDDFDFGKSFPEGTFVYFLTHFHADHYEGLSPRWNYGPINCTHATARFILDERNYPKLTCVHAHDYNKIETLTLPNNHTVHYVLLDAKHIPGSAMILFQGFMGTILFTGDFRYEYSMVTENPELFPASLREHHTKQ